MFLRKFFILIVFLFIITNFSSIVFSTSSSLSILSPNYFSEQTNVYKDIHYLKNEFLSFNFCPIPGSENLSAQIVCSKSNQVNLPLFNSEEKGCYFSNYNLANISCSNFSLQVSYNYEGKENTLKRTFKEQKQSLIINHILNQDYTQLNSLDLSYYLLTLNNVNGINSQKSNDIYKLIKNDRNNANKCWPANSCSMLTTTKILENLKLAGYGLDSRLLQDGKTYLQKNMVNNANNPLTASINVSNGFTNSSSIECSLKIDSEPVKNYILDKSNHFIQALVSNNINLSCNESVNQIIFNLSDSNGNLKNFQTFYDQKSFSYSLNPFTCIGDNGNCNFDATLNALTIYSNGLSNYSDLESYVNSLINGNSSIIGFETNKGIANIGKYLFYNNNNNLLDNLEFHQNNDGSWGSGSNQNKIFQTAWSILGLESKKNDAEYISDGKKWIYYNEPSYGWNSIENNTLAYLAIKESIKPYLKISAKNQIHLNTNFNLSNPTIYNLKDIKLTFDKNINKYLSYKQSLGDLGPNEEINFNVSLNPTFFGEASGNMQITGVDSNGKVLDLITMPVTLSGPKPFDISYANISMVSNDNKNISIKVLKNLNQFNASCSYINPFDKITRKIPVNQNSKQIEIPNKILLAGNYSFSLDCISGKNKFSFPISLNVNIAQQDFTVQQTKANLNSLNGFALQVTNIMKNKEILNFSIQGDLNGIVVPGQKNMIIAANDTRDVFFTITDKQALSQINTTSTNIVISSKDGYVKKIPIVMDLGNGSSSGLALWEYIVLGIFAILIIFILIARFINSRRNEESEFGGENDEIYFDDNFDFK